MLRQFTDIKEDTPVFVNENDVKIVYIKDNSTIIMISDDVCIPVKESITDVAKIINGELS